MNIVLTGLNGYGAHFIEALLANETKDRLVAVVSRNPKKSQYYEQLKEKQVSIYSTLKECLEQETIEFAIITTPIHIHYMEVMEALDHGVNVYCEKPLAPTIQECIAIQKRAKEKNCVVAVGFQWSYATGILALKKDILEGRYKKIKRIKTLVRWTRPKSYFETSNWKGRLFGEQGEPILDCLISNGAAHFLHNLLFLSGKTMETAATPIYVEGTTYKAHHIEGMDTAAIRILTEEGPELLYYGTIVSPEQRQPIFEIELEDGNVVYPGNEQDEIVATKRDGSIIRYPSPEQGRFLHFFEVMDSIKEKKSIPCDVTTVLPEVIVVNAVIEQIPLKRFAQHEIYEDKRVVYVNDISERFEECYEQNSLLEGQKRSSNLREYRFFQGL